jgi:hypothetical protein
VIESRDMGKQYSEESRLALMGRCLCTIDGGEVGGVRVEIEMTCLGMLKRKNESERDELD